MKLGFKINQKELINMAIGMLAVKAAPVVLDKIFPNSTLNSGMTGNLLAGAVGVGVGVVMKSPTVQTVAAATAISEIINDTVVEPIFTKMLATTAPQKQGARVGAYTNTAQVLRFPKNNSVYSN